LLLAVTVFSSAVEATFMPDFDDIMPLCSEDRHWGALKLLRSLF